MKRQATGAASQAQAVQTAADIRRILADMITTVTANPDLDPLPTARVIAQLAGAALRAIEVEGLAARVAAIEGVLKFRNQQQTKEDKR